MMDIIIQIIVEVLSILGIATKEIKQSRLSKYSPYKCITVDRTIGLFREIWEEADWKDRHGRHVEEARQTDT